MSWHFQAACYACVAVQNQTTHPTMSWVSPKSHKDKKHGGEQVDAATRTIHVAAQPTAALGAKHLNMRD